MYQYKKLENGIRVVIEKLPEIRSCTIGFFVGAGSATERNAENGISHFIEHMLFKGTKKRTYREIAEEIDNIGGQINAFTAKECTCYYAKVIDEKQSIVVDVLSDMLENSQFLKEEMDKERGVVIEEIAMSEDTPDDVAQEKLQELFFEGTEFSKTILGPAEIIRGISKQNIQDYMGRTYTTDNIVIVAVGNIDEDALIDDLNQKLSGTKTGSKESVIKVPEKWSTKPQFAAIEKDIEQVHACIGLRAYGFENSKKYATSIISNILGGSMSSRLFQRIREEMGAAYSVYSYPSMYMGAGMLSIYAGTSQEKIFEVTEEILKEIEHFSITEQELFNTKEQIRGNYILSQESMSTKMNAVGKNMILTGACKTENEILDAIEAITMEDIKQASEYLFDLNYASAVYVGKVSNPDRLKGFFI